MQTTQLLGVGVAAQLTCDAELVLREGHPALHPGFQLQVTLDDEVVMEADPLIGLMHRSAEKLFESRDYRQAMLLANRHDWLSPFTSEVCAALAIEEALGITVPIRATWIRTLLMEIERTSAILAFLSPVVGVEQVDALRERLLSVRASITGARIHPGFARIGGVAAPLNDGDLDDLAAVLAAIEHEHPRITDALAGYTAAFAGVARLSLAQAESLAVTGVVGRASGLDLDVRRDAPYLAYAEFADVLQVVIDPDGDVPARYRTLLGDAVGAVQLATACIDRLRGMPEGSVDVPLPKVVRLPEGVAYAQVEGPLGTCGCLIASDGEKTPLRMKIRSASFATMQALGPALRGTPRAQLPDAVMSFPLVLGDADR